MYIMCLYLLIGIFFVTPPAITRDLQNKVSCRGASNLTQFQCQNGHGCVDMEHVCDGIQQCLDASDEGHCSHRRNEFRTMVPGLHRIRRQSTCGSIQWDCHDGSCISSEKLCNGAADCVDRSDENNPFCRGIASSNTGGCILPPYPMYGTYEVAKFPDARPGQALDSFVITISCRRGFGVVDPNGGDGSSTQQLYCVNGEYQYKSMPKCVRFCKLKPDPSVRYMCHVPGVGFKVCPYYVAPGTYVNPVCNKPIYYSSDYSSSYMKCIAGFWDNVAQCRAECGRVTPESTVLVIDGKEAMRGELPWHAGVYRKKDNYQQICSGSLISNNVVISAAHCFWNDYTTKLLPASDFAVAIGKIYREWDSDLDADAQKSDVKEIRVPILFQGAAANYQEDIAALILTTPFIYKLYIRPVCLYFDQEFERFQMKEGNSGKVAGWGLTATNGKPAETLKVLEMPYVPADVCIKALPQAFREYITGDKFCAGQLSDKALCKGDSGGGLAFADRGLGIDRYYLRGIVSAAPKDDKKLCNNHVYTAFTRVSKHQDFINEVLAMSAEKKCPLYAFQCDDGSCVGQGSDCNGIRECADGSDETDALCKPGAKPEPDPSGSSKPVPLGRPEPTPLVISGQTNPVTTDKRNNSEQISCVLPEFPEHGFYSTNTPNSQPGQSFGSVLLTVTCRKRYMMKDPKYGVDVESTQIECHNGRWNSSMPKCVAFCRLTLDVSVKFSCPGSSGCKEYVENGTAVSVSCNRPDYYSDEVLPKMRCIDGFWDYVARCKTECGQEKLLGLENDLKVLIKEGTPAQHGEVPWHVGIHLKTAKPYRQICGGSIVSRKVVISAAHCFWDKNLLPASDYAVAAGKIFRAWNDNRDDAYNRDKETQMHQKSDVKEINVPSDFNGAENDIALLTLVTPFEFGPLIRPVCLDFDHNFDRWQFGPTGKVAGWGQTSIGGNFSPILRVVEVPNVGITECQLTSLLKEKYTDKFCTNSRNGGETMCDGFGGEGLVFPGSNTEPRFFLRGVVSKLSVGDHVCNGTFNIFTSILHYANFITWTMKGSL